MNTYPYVVYPQGGMGRGGNVPTDYSLRNVVQYLNDSNRN